MSIIKCRSHEYNNQYQSTILYIINARLASKAYEVLSSTAKNPYISFQSHIIMQNNTRHRCENHFLLHEHMREQSTTSFLHKHLWAKKLGFWFHGEFFKESFRLPSSGSSPSSFTFICVVYIFFLHMSHTEDKPLVLHPTWPNHKELL